MAKTDREATASPTPRTPRTPVELSSVSQEIAEERKKTSLNYRRLEQELRWREKYASNLRWIMIIQIVIADILFAVYLCQNAWSVPVAAISVYLSATVVEVIGLVYVITTSLFPNRGKKRK
ncbi:MAG: hypothetical protein LBI33_02680 [Propionibacteriaceae bacterium]|jgi:predicted tellurium resistance membrane protein TerC|nr:hypothetical protein [Propionibacteriaceae bacterium]